MTETILVTGGCGFIGSNFIRHIVQVLPDTRIVNLDALTYSGNRANLKEIEGNPRYTFIHGDVRDAPLIGNVVSTVDAVVHFAAESHVDRSIENGREFLDTNVFGTHTLLEAVRHNPSVRLLNVGTDEVYGSLPLEPASERFNEDSAIRPNSPYSATKAAADCLVRAYHKTYGLDVVTTRCSNNFGPYQLPEKVIPLFVTNLLQGWQIPLYGDGRNVRDWLHVEDHCEALVKVLEHGRSGEVYNIGGNNECSNIELTKAILSALEMPESMIDFVPDRLGHDRRYAIDAGKIEREIGWRPSRSAWPNAINETVEWYRRNENWWRPLCRRLRAPVTPQVEVLSDAV